MFNDQSRQVDTRESVSAVIPTLNRPDFLLRAVRSVQQQSHPVDHIVIVISGPDDTTRQLAKTWDDPRISVIASDERLNGSQARNRGVQESNSEWIAFLDDDDEWLPNHIEAQFRLLHSLPAQPGGEVVLTSRYLARRKEVDFLWPKYIYQNGQNMGDYLFFRDRIGPGTGGIQTSTLLIPRSLLVEVPFDNTLEVHQDWDWLIRVSARPNTRIETVRVPTTIFHMHASSRVSGSSAEKTWGRSYEWIQLMRPLVSDRGYTFFVASIVVPRCRRGDLRTLIFLLRSFPPSWWKHLRAIITALIYWSLGRSLGRRLQDFVQKLRPKPIKEKE